MKDPELTVGLAERGEKPVLLISRNDSQMFNRIDHGLEQLAESGYMGACYDVGESVLRMLSVAHPATLSAYPALTPPIGPVISACDLISLLHHQSLEDRTCRYVDAIDALIERHKNELANTSISEQWPTFRAHLMRTFAG